MKLEEMRKNTIDELSELIIDFKKQLFGLRLQKSLNKLEDTSQLGKIKRMIAQAKTIIKQKQNEEVTKNA